MTSKARPEDSWLRFWIIQALMAPASILLVHFVTSVIGGQDLTIGQSARFGLMMSAGGATFGLIHRAITGRNRSLGFFYIFAFMPIYQLQDRPMEAMTGYAGFVGIMSAFFALMAVGQRYWADRKAKPRRSPMADAELDARPVARTYSSRD